MVRIVRCPSFAKTYFTPNELCGWEEGISFGYISKEKPKEKKSKPMISLLPIVIQNKILVGKPAKLRSL